MNQPQLMRQIADAMERNPKEWWSEFEWVNMYGRVINPPDPDNLFYAMSMGREVRPKPSTYTLRVQEMPEPLREVPEYGSEFWYIDPADEVVTSTLWVDSQRNMRMLNAGLCYPDQTTAREALEKLTKAMGGSYRGS